MVLISDLIRCEAVFRVLFCDLKESILFWNLDASSDLDIFTFPTMSPVGVAGGEIESNTSVLVLYVLQSTDILMFEAGVGGSGNCWFPRECDLVGVDFVFDVFGLASAFLRRLDSFCDRLMRYSSERRHFL